MTTAKIFDLFYYTAFWAGANVRGWVGFLVQSYDAAIRQEVRSVYPTA
jgi:hypothetical protein